MPKTVQPNPMTPTQRAVGYDHPSPKWPEWQNEMTLHIGDMAPDFTTKKQAGAS
jgi:hypothetical protein